PLATKITYGDEASVRLKPGASMRGFVAAASALARGYPGSGGKIDVISPADAVTALDQGALPEAIALAAFAALAGLITLAGLIQLLTRQLALESAEFPVLRAFGATRGTLVVVS